MVQSQAVSLRNLENHIGQLAIALSNRPHGSLPSNTEDPRRKGKEHCKVINLRSGKVQEVLELNWDMQSLICIRVVKESDLVFDSRWINVELMNINTNQSKRQRIK